MVDIARSPEVKRKKKIRRIILAAVGLVVVGAVTYGVSRLRPAAPGVDRATVWIDTVKRGELTRQVRGSGILVPENIRWIPATTSGRVERLVIRPGAQVTPTTVILEMTNPDLEQQVMDARLAFESAKAALENRRATLQNDLLTQEAAVATAESNHTQAMLTLERERAAVQGSAHLGRCSSSSRRATRRRCRTASTSREADRDCQGRHAVADRAAGSRRQPAKGHLRSAPAPAR